MFWTRFYCIMVELSHDYEFVWLIFLVIIYVALM